MKKSLLACVALAVAAAAVAGCSSSATEAVQVAAKAENFQLTDHNGRAMELRRLHDVDAIVLVSQANGDATSRAAAAALSELQASHAGVAFFMINSSLEDDRAAITAEAEAQGFTVDVLDDHLQLVGESLGVTRTGQTFVINPKTWDVIYSGPVDGAEQALASLASGEVIEAAHSAGNGAEIAFPQRANLAAHAEISYADTIAPILEAKCVTCHQDGGIGPFAMTDYNVVKGFAPMIRETIRTERMPPWHPDPTVNAFKHAQGLSDEQKLNLVHWIEAGAPRGEGEDPLALAERDAPEWPLGEPDLVVNIPAYDVPASGVVDYQYPAVEIGNETGRWVKAATFLPGDRQSVHHILAGYMPEIPASGRGSTSEWESSYGDYAVGGNPFQTPADSGIYLPANGAMGFQMHYTTYGKAATDNSRMGLYFYPEDEQPRLKMRQHIIADAFIELPANTDDHKEVAYATFGADAVMHSIFLHTHVRGKSAQVDLITPDGEMTTVVNVPRYDFNWQRIYEFEEPVNIPAGSKLVTTYYYDNSVRNPANPDPDETVVWGAQTWEEMHYSTIYYRWADETVAQPISDEVQDQRLPRRALIGLLDDDFDGKVQQSELRGAMAARLGPRFDALDANKDGGIDGTELAVIASSLALFSGGGQ